MSELQSAISGSLSGAAATCIVYPYDTIKTKWSIGSDSSGLPYRSLTDVLTRSLQEGGWLSLYRGLPTKVGMTILQRFIYFYVLTYLQKRVSRRFGKASLTTSLLLGYVAGVCSSLIMTPLEVLQTRAQVNSKSQTTLLHALHEGTVLDLYAGFSTNIVLCINPAIETVAFDKLKQSRSSVKKLTDVDIFLLGAVAKCIATLLTYPYVRAKLLQQATGDPRSLPELILGMSRKFKLFQGIGSQLIKVVLTSAVAQVIKNRIETI